MAATVSLNSARAINTRLAFLMAAASGDTLALSALADWLDDNGSGRQARSIRSNVRACEHISARSQGMYLKTAARRMLRAWAERLVDETAFKTFNARIGNRPDDPLGDGSMEYCLRRGYVPTLQRGKARQERLGRIVEALGWRVFWIA